MSEPSTPESSSTPPGYWICPKCECGFDARPKEMCPACRQPVDELPDDLPPEEPPPEGEHHKRRSRR